MARRPSKNAVCPCGSGKRYKSCCLRTQQDQHTQAASLHDDIALLNQVCDEMTRWFDCLPEASRQKVQPDVSLTGGDTLLRQWSVLDRLGLRDPALFKKTLRVLDAKLATEANNVLAGQDGSFIGIWEVLRHDVDGVRLQEGLTGARMSMPFAPVDTLHVHEHLMMRVVRQKNRWVPTAWTDTPLPPRAAFILVKQLRLGLSQVSSVPEESEITVAHLAVPDARYGVLRLGAGSWELLLNHQLSRTLSTGEVSATVLDRYGLPGLHRDIVLRRLMALNPSEMSASEDQIVQWTDATGSDWIGEARLDGDHLTVLAPSVIHADRLQRQLETAFADELTHLDRQEEREKIKLLDKLKEGVEWEFDPNAPADLQEAVQAQLAVHWESWPDAPHVALAQQTPRAALATPEGRKKVQELVGEAAWAEAQRPAWQRYGMERVRRTLGFSPPDSGWSDEATLA